MGSKEKKRKHRTKVVVRHLPYYLTEENFKELIKEYEDDIDYVYFECGKKDKKIKYAYAFINFTDISTLLRFYKKFNGHVFFGC